MAALPACSDLAPTSCAPCLFSAQSTYLEYPYHVVPVTVDIVPYVWQLNNGTNTTYISRITQTVGGSGASETGLIYDEDQTPVWTVNGVELTSGRTYAQYTNFVGAAPTAGCANPVADSDIELPATANPSSLIYALPAGNVHTVPAATSTAVLDYLGSLQTVVAQLGGNEPAACPTTVASSSQPTACISSSLSSTVTCYDYLYGETKCVTQSRLVKRTVDLLKRQEQASSAPQETKTMQMTIATPTAPTETTSSESSSSTSPIPSTTTSSSASASLESSSASTSVGTPPPESSSSSQESSSATSVSSSSSVPASSAQTSPSPTLESSSSQSSSESSAPVSSSSSVSPESSSSAASSSAATSSSSSLSSSELELTTTLTRTLQGTTAVLTTIITALPDTQVPSSSAVVITVSASASSSVPPQVTKSGATSITQLTTRSITTTVFSSPPVITSSSNRGTGTVLSEILGTTTVTNVVISSETTPPGTPGSSLPPMTTTGGFAPLPIVGTSTITIVAGNGTTSTITNGPGPQIHSTTVTYYDGPNGTSVSVVQYTGAAQRAAAVPMRGLFGAIASLAVGL